MRAPDFWRAEGAASRLLAPIDALYGVIAARRLRREAPGAALPTIVVGGLTAGGDGKTPLAILLAQALSAQGEIPAMLVRGYGGSRGRASPLVAHPGEKADLLGDEAPLLACQGLTIVGADRVASARLAKERGATALVLDDGFQSRRLAPDLVLLAIDSDYGAGNGRCIPAGPLRAPLDAQLAAADALVLIGDGAAGKALAERAAKPALQARIIPDPRIAQEFAGARVVAFAGIGRPEKFFETLRKTGAEVVATRSFPDHHRFGDADLAELAALGRKHDARLVTTMKDALRLRGRSLEFRALPVTLVAPDMAGLTSILAAALDRGRLRAS